MPRSSSFSSLFSARRAALCHCRTKTPRSGIARRPRRAKMPDRSLFGIPAVRYSARQGICEATLLGASLRGAVTAALAALLVWSKEPKFWLAAGAGLSLSTTIFAAHPSRARMHGDAAERSHVFNRVKDFQFPFDVAFLIYPLRIFLYSLVRAEPERI